MDDVLDDLGDESLVFGLKLQNGAGLECGGVLIPRPTQQFVEHFLPPVGDLSVEVAGDLSADAVPREVYLVAAPVSGYDNSSRRFMRASAKLRR